MMNKTNQETKLLAIAVTIAAVAAAGLAASLTTTTTQIADAFVGGYGGGCSELPDGTISCSGGSGINDNPGFVDEGGDGPDGEGGHYFYNEETGDRVDSGGGSGGVGQPSQDNQKEGSGYHCEGNLYDGSEGHCVGTP